MFELDALVFLLSVICSVKMMHIAFLLLVTAPNLRSASVNKENLHGDMAMSMIRFPDDSKPQKLVDIPLANKFGEVEVHDTCKGLTYCTVRPPNYPEDKFNDLFKDYKIPPLPTLDVIGNRQGDIDFESGCESDVTYEPLYTVREKRDEPWLTVIQAPKHNYVQRIRLETCKTVGDTCFKPFLPVTDFVTSCEQMYNKWEVLVESPDGKGNETIQATLPVCCSCKYKHIPFLSRFNLEAGMKDNNTTIAKTKSVAPTSTNLKNLTIKH